MSTDVAINPASYAIDQILVKMNEIHETSNNIQEKGQLKWFQDFSPCQLVAFCCFCFPCCLYLTHATAQAANNAIDQANTVRLSRAEVDGLTGLIESLRKCCIKPSEQQSGNQHALFPAQSPEIIKNAANKTINAIQNTLSNPEIIKMRSCFHSIMASVASAHYISLQNHLSQAKNSEDEMKSLASARI
ncbi:MAG: hypothetical protein P4M14_02000 [Gammaproteobacteria bacterium]|nr:hypothetical protein [Gammaproteobacteria bacterium]